MDLEESKMNNFSLNDKNLCKQYQSGFVEEKFSPFDLHHPLKSDFQQENWTTKSSSSNTSNQFIKGTQTNSDETTISLSSYRYVFVLAQIFHGIGASALISLGVTYLDESVNKKDAPVFIGIFEASFVLGPAIGYVMVSLIAQSLYDTKLND